MNRPDNTTMFLGHPVVATPLLLMFGGTAVLGIINYGFDWVVLILLVLSGWILNCCKAASSYRAWRDEWDALDPDRAPRPQLRRRLS